MPIGKDGKPVDRSYLEKNLSFHLRKAIDDYVNGEKAGKIIDYSLSLL